jgi:hypothetical protein
MTTQAMERYYEKNLEKVKKVHGDSCKGEEYVTFAKGQLEAVRKNGEEGLLSFFKKHDCPLNETYQAEVIK